MVQGSQVTGQCPLSQPSMLLSINHFFMGKAGTHSNISNQTLGVDDEPHSILACIYGMFVTHAA